MASPVKWVRPTKREKFEKFERPSYVNNGPMVATQDSRNQTSMSQRNRHRRGKVSLPKVDFD